MSKLKIDLTCVDSNTVFEAMPDGEYDIKINDFEEKEGPKGPYISWEFGVTSGDFKGRKLWRITSLSEAALGFLKELMDAAGVSYTKGGFDPKDAVGAKLKCRVITESHPEFGDKNIIKKFLGVNTSPKSKGKAPYKGKKKV